MSKLVTLLTKSASETLCQQLREKRLEKNILQTELAEIVGLKNRQSIEHMENQRDNTRISIGLLYAICITLGLEPKDIMPTVKEICERANIDIKQTQITRNIIILQNDLK